MKARLLIFTALLALLTSIPESCAGQGLAADLNEKVDAIADFAYQSASSGFPCKIKSSGKPKMLRRDDVDRCLNAAHDRVDWEDVSRRLQSLRQDGRTSWIDLAAAFDSSLARRAISYDKVLKVKDMKALLPLSNSVLKYLPDNSLMDLPVFTRKGEQVGVFAGVYTYDRTGELAAANNYKLSVFQYTDADGNIQIPPSANRLLLDRFGVPWKDAAAQPGFRLTSARLSPRN